MRESGSQVETVELNKDKQKDGPNVPSKRIKGDLTIRERKSKIR